MKSLITYIEEAKQTNVSYNPEEVEKSNKLLQKQNRNLKLICASDEDIQHIYIKNVNDKKFYDEIKDLRVTDFALGEIDKELANNLWLIMFTYDKVTGRNMVRGVETTHLQPVLNNQGMFFSSKQEVNKFLKEYRDKIKYSVQEPKRPKVKAVTLSEFLDEAEKLRKTYSWDILPMKFIK